MIPIYKPFLPPKILKYAHDAIDSGWVSSQGEFKERAENKLKILLNVKYVLLLNSGTAAVHLMARSLFKFYPEISNIFVPNNVYVAAWNGFLFDKNYTLTPIDANINTWNMNYNLINSVDESSALLVVHNVNSTINVPSLYKQYGDNTIILEDACEGFLGKYDGKYTGTKSLCSSISFFGNKSITCGEGGALITDNKDIYEYSKKLHGQGQSNIRYIHDDLGYNYRLTNISAAILYGQLTYLDEIIDKKKYIFNSYTNLFSNISKIKLQETDENTEKSNWMFGLRIIGNKNGYKHLEKYCNENGVDIRPMFFPMSEHTYMKQYHNKDNEIIATLLSNECFMIPSYPDLEDKDIEKVYDTIKTYVEKYID